MPTISTTARRLRAYQATLDRRARPARPTTASRRCAPTGDGTLHALLTVLAYYRYHWYPILPYFYTVIGSIDLLASSDSPVYVPPSLGHFLVRLAGLVWTPRGLSGPKYAGSGLLGVRWGDLSR